MKVQIYSKNNPSEPQNYDVTLQEFRRLARDWEKYLTEGTPKTGMYNYYIDTEHKEQKHLFLDFERISLIG